MARQFTPLRRRIERKLQEYRDACLDVDEAKQEYSRLLKIHPQLVEQAEKHRRQQTTAEALKCAVEFLAKQDYKLHGDNDIIPGIRVDEVVKVDQATARRYLLDKGYHSLLTVNRKGFAELVEILSQHDDDANLLVRYNSQ